MSDISFVLGYAFIQCCNILIGLIQLAAVDSVSRGFAYFACCYAADLAVCSNSHLTQLSACGGDLAVVAACIAYVQLAVTQCGITGIYAVLQYYVADFTCSCDYFAVFIYGEVVVCCVECAGAVYQERHDSVFSHSTYGQVVFGVQCIGLNIVYINVFVQLNLNLSAFMAYADVLVAAEINIIAGFYFGCFGCNTVGRQIPTCISSVAYFFQLAYVYSVSVSFACFYIGNLLTVCVQTAAGDICLVAITNASIRHIELSCFYAVYSQSLLQCQTSFSNLKVIFAILQLHRNCIIFSANGNTIACCISGVFCIYGVNVLSICSCSFFYRSDVGTCFYLCFSCCA